MNRAVLVALDAAKMRSREAKVAAERPGGGDVEEVLTDALHKKLRRIVKEHVLYKRAIDAVICQHTPGFEEDACDGCTIQRILKGG